MNNLRINNARFQQRMEKISRPGSFNNGTGVHRLALSTEDFQARELFKKWCKAERLDLKVDGIGNMFGVYGKSDAPPIMMGSHLDSVAYGGRFDGSLGVIAALEVIETIKENKIQLNHPLVVANFTNEEGVRFTPDMMGSMVYSRQLDIATALQVKATDNGKTVKEELEANNYLDNYKMPDPAAFVELHIEQGPVLENEHMQIGAVDSVTGIVWLEILINGEANHAGTTPLVMRKDAGLIAGQIITYVRDLAIEVDGLLTVGTIQFEPNVTNVIPEKAKLTVDIRNSDLVELKESKNRLIYFLKHMEHSYGINIRVRELVNVAPVQFDHKVVECVKSSAKELRLSVKKMGSGAGHDAQMLAKVCPSGMIFIPSRDGKSHSQNEYSTPKETEEGANTLLHTVLRLDRELSG